MTVQTRLFHSNNDKMIHDEQRNLYPNDKMIHINNDEIFTQIMISVTSFHSHSDK
jgi:hypothetical protein